MERLKGCRPGLEAPSHLPSKASLLSSDSKEPEMLGVPFSKITTFVALMSLASCVSYIHSYMHVLRLIDLRNDDTLEPVRDSEFKQDIMTLSQCYAQLFTSLLALAGIARGKTWLLIPLTLVLVGRVVSEWVLRRG